ncbi:SMP-30/gluconolactonase/LRE family protein [Streptomyces laurentii]|uniref:SMP-30/gluconolactonase/LRE family protein n=1 Tax=Streptomyces laurentii TaxID=39478 RepID=UPI003406E205
MTRLRRRCRRDGSGGRHSLVRGCSGGPALDEPAGRLHLADTTIMIVDVFDLDVGTGTLSDRRRFLDFREAGVWPDGMSVDDDGMLWIAQPSPLPDRRDTQRSSARARPPPPVRFRAAVAARGGRVHPSEHKRWHGCHSRYLLERVRCQCDRRPRLCQRTRRREMPCRAAHPTRLPIRRATARSRAVPTANRPEPAGPHTPRPSPGALRATAPSSMSCGSGSPRSRHRNHHPGRVTTFFGRPARSS